MFRRPAVLLCLPGFCCFHPFKRLLSRRLRNSCEDSAASWKLLLLSQCQFLLVVISIFRKILRMKSKLAALDRVPRFANVRVQSSTCNTFTVWPEGAARRVLEPLRCFQGNELLKRERKLSQVQSLVLQQYLRKSNNWMGFNVSLLITACPEKCFKSNNFKKYEASR